MIPKNINQEHALAAIREIDRDGVPTINLPDKFWLIYEGGSTRPNTS
jgi:hypothetical protein